MTAGFFVALVLSWYHGERGAQRFGGGELLIIALLLAIGGLVVGHFGPLASVPQAAPDRAATAPIHAGTIGSTSSVAPRPMGNAMPAMVAQPIPTKSIAVLPFENLSSDKENEYFVSGMQDLILAKLGDIGELKVISRTSTMQYKSRPGNLKKVAAELGVATILEGSVQKQGKQVLINVQLIDARSDAHLWAETYKRTLDDIFGVEGEVAEKIATALNAKLSQTQTASLAAAPTTNPAAYDLFLRAEYQVNHKTFKAAIPLYQQAIAEDPGFALAWARLSYSESALAWFSVADKDVEQLIRQARSDAEQALKLAPNLAAAQLAIGYADYYGRRDYAAVLEAFDAALALRPNDADALAARGYIERRQGRFDDAIVSLQQALAHDPRNSGLAAEIGITCMLASRYAEAETWSRRALALDPGNLGAKGTYSGAILLGSGDVARALAEVGGDAPELKGQRVYLLTLQRKFGEAIALLQSIPDIDDNFSNQDGGSKALRLAYLYWLAGDMTKAQPLFAEALPKARGKLALQQNIYQAYLWNYVAMAELGMGDIAEGLDATAKAQSIAAGSMGPVGGPVVMSYSASLYARIGRPDLAVPLLTKALAAPGIGLFYSPVLLWLDPALDPIRSDPRFQALLKQYAKYKPTVLYEPAPVGSTSTGDP